MKLPEEIVNMAQALQDDERVTFTVKEFNSLVVECGVHEMTRSEVRETLEALGYTLENLRTRHNIVTRGVLSNPNGNRWAECPSHGGAGISPHTGAATGQGGSGRTWTPGGKGCLP